MSVWLRLGGTLKPRDGAPSAEKAEVGWTLLEVGALSLSGLNEQIKGGCAFF
jgi:hypothetical protein